MSWVLARHAEGDFNERLSATLARLAEEVTSALGRGLVALVLGGGYGRGEGGVVKRDGVLYPYNDLDLTLVVASRRTSVDALVPIGARYRDALGIHVDFSRPLTKGDIRHWPRWLMWFDLLHGHIVLSGREDVLTAHAPAYMREPLPAIEATRLLLNRGAGVLWAMRMVRGEEVLADADFVRRNYYKCALALGDALLLAHARYAAPYRGRDLALERLASENEAVRLLGLNALYAEALRFKFSPDDAPSAAPGFDALAALSQRWGRVYLHVEETRTKSRWESMAAYVAWQGNREARENLPRFWPRNALRNWQMKRLSLRYPREELYRNLPRLLGLAGGTRQRWGQESAAFLDVWRKFAG